MSIERVKLKNEAKLAMREAQPGPVLVTLVLMVIVAILQVLSMSLNGDFDAYTVMFEAAMAGEEIPFVQPAGATGFGWILSLAIELMAMVLSVGYSLYVLRISRRIKAGVGDMFDAFGLFFRAIYVSILPGFLVTAWAMIYALPTTMIAMSTGAYWIYVAGLPLLIPAIRAEYAYRQTVFIMLDNPHLNCIQCIALSKAAMEGHKWELFKLDLSFIGWQMLCVIPFVGLWVRPYMSITYANYYAAVMQDLAVRTGHIPNFEGEEPSEKDTHDTM